MQADVAAGPVANNPYAFVGLDWHWTLWIALLNVALPSAAYYAFAYESTTASQKRITAFTAVATMHVSLWGPLILLSVLPGAIPAFYLQHISSNFNPTVYLIGAAVFANLYYQDGESLGKWAFWAYSLIALFFRYEEKMRGTFAMYYLNPRSKTLDPQLHPSFQYGLGWREHRYRYYHYFPEATPAFDL